MLILAVAGWGMGTALSFVNERRLLGSISLLLGVGALVGIYVFGIGYIGVIVLAVLAVVTLLFAKFDAP